MEGYINVVENRIDSLVQITIKERKENGLGCLFLNFSKPNHLDCAYISINSENFPEHLNEYKERMKGVPSSIIFFYVFDDKDNKMIEMDLDKNSKFFESENQNKNNNLN